MSNALGRSDRAVRAPAYEDPRPEVQAAVPLRSRRILDVGCSSGILGEALKQRQQAEIVGIELNASYIEDARRRVDHVIHADVEELVQAANLESDLGFFDCIIASDVLEHLRDPWTVLGVLVGLAQPGAAIVISLPNVRNWETLSYLIRRGTWPRRDSGIFDRTHLRWFTLRDARELVEGAGLEIQRIEPTFRHGTRMRWWDRYLHHLEGTPLEPFVAFQYVIVARRMGGC